MASSVTITPALGAGLAMSQVGPPTGFDAIDDRRCWSAAPIQEGALSAGSYEVTQRAAGVNLSIDVAASIGDGACVQGDSVTAQGLYRVPPTAAAINVDIAAADPSNPRVDLVVLEAKDATHDVGGLNLARVRVISGTPTSGATLANRTGAAALPASAMLLADVLVPATDTTISNNQIRDRRTWARGAYVRLVRTAGSLTFTGAFAQLSSTLQARIECSGVPVRIGIHGRWNHNTAAGRGDLQPVLDGSGIDSLTTAYTHTFPAGGASDYATIAAEYTFTPAAGSHLLEWYAQSTGATLTVSAVAAAPCVVTIEELVRQNTVNNATTSG